MKESQKIKYSSVETRACEGELVVCTDGFSNLLLEKGASERVCGGERPLRIRSLKGELDYSTLNITEQMNLSSGKTRLALQKKCQSGVSGVLIEDGKVIIGLGFVESKENIDRFISEMFNGLSDIRFRKVLD